MNKEQLEAIKTRLEKYSDTCSSRESEMLAMYMGEEDVPVLVAEVERLREALKFYADGQKYTLAYDSNLVGTVEIFKDNGKKARQALGDGDE